MACPSTLKMVDKEILKKSLKEVGGQVSRDWSEDCTHLCMSSVTVTEKVPSLCLFQLIYIIQCVTWISEYLTGSIQFFLLFFLEPCVFLYFYIFFKKLNINILLFKTIFVQNPW